MSHSRIIQVSTSPIKADERHFANDYDFERFQAEIPMMDYFKESSDEREADLTWFGEELQKLGFSLSEETISINPDKLDSDFIRVWKAAAIDAAEKFDISEMYRIARGEYFCSMYVYDMDDGFPKPLWQWAYDVLELCPKDTKYYVGGFLDYHF